MHINQKTHWNDIISIGTNRTIDHWFNESYPFVYIGHVCV